MSKKNNKKNADIEAVAAEVASEVTTNEVDTDNTETTDTDNTAEPDASANVEIVSDNTDPTEHHIRVKSDSGVFDVIVHAQTRQDAKYKVYLQLEQFGENATVPKFNVDKYIARQNSSAGKKGKKKGEGKKTRSVVVVDLDNPDFSKDTDNTEVTDNIGEREQFDEASYGSAT